MLIALLTMMLLGGGGGIDPFPKDVQKRVVTIVADESRAEGIVAQMRYIQGVGAEAGKEAHARFKAWTKKDLDHDAGPELLTEALDEADAAREASIRKFTDGLYAMKAQMSRAEWEELFTESE